MLLLHTVKLRITEVMDFFVVARWILFNKVGKSEKWEAGMLEAGNQFD
jgi:hypothetical protein